MKIAIAHPNSRDSVLASIEYLKDNLSGTDLLWKENFDYIYEDVKKSDISFIDLTNRKKETIRRDFVEPFYQKSEVKRPIPKEQIPNIINSVVIVKFDIGLFEKIPGEKFENVYKYSNYMNDFKSMMHGKPFYINNVGVYEMHTLSVLALNKKVQHDGIENCILLFENMDHTLTIIYNSAFTTNRTREDIKTLCDKELGELNLSDDDEIEDKYEELKRKYKRLQKKYKKLKQLNKE